MENVPLSIRQIGQKDVWGSGIGNRLAQSAARVGPGVVISLTDCLVHQGNVTWEGLAAGAGVIALTTLADEARMRYAGWRSRRAILKAAERQGITTGQVELKHEKRGLVRRPFLVTHSGTPLLYRNRIEPVAVTKRTATLQRGEIVGYQRRDWSLV